MFQELIERFAKFTTDDESAAWQARIDRDYLLEIDGVTVTLYRNKTSPAIQNHRDGEDPIEIQNFVAGAEVLTKFDWINVIEVQSLSSNGKFPPLYWCFIMESGQYLIPDGGRYAGVLEQDFIYKLPRYHDQQVVEIQPPTGFDRALSMWRKNDPYPKRTPSDDD